MGFGNLKSENGLQALNEYLADKSYVEGSVNKQNQQTILEIESPKIVLHSQTQSQTQSQSVTVEDNFWASNSQ